MDGFLYDNGLRHERVKHFAIVTGNVNIAKFLITPILKNVCKRLLLKVSKTKVGTEGE